MRDAVGLAYLEEDVNRRDFGWAMLAGAVGACFDSAAAQINNAKRPSGVETWRRMFPALGQRVHGHPLVYLDSAATTQRPLPVLDAIMDFYRNDNANPGAALHELARRAHERYEGARRTLATFVSAVSPAEIVWVRGTTEGINLVATAWARSHLGRNDEILLTIAEHASNLLPWRLAAEATGARVRFVDVDDQGRVSLEDLERKLFVHAGSLQAFGTSATARRRGNCDSRRRSCGAAAAEAIWRQRGCQGFLPSVHIDG